LAAFARKQDRRVAPIVLPSSGLETLNQSLDTSGPDDIDSLPSRPAAKAFRGVEVEPNPLSTVVARWNAKSGLHPSVQEIKPSPSKEWARHPQSWTGFEAAIHQERGPCRFPKPSRQSFFSGSNKPSGLIDEE
jgi:hypothetical protein